MRPGQIRYAVRSELLKVGEGEVELAEISQIRYGNALTKLVAQMKSPLVLTASSLISGVITLSGSPA